MSGPNAETGSLPPYPALLAEDDATLEMLLFGRLRRAQWWRLCEAAGRAGVTPARQYRGEVDEWLGNRRG